MHKSPRIVLEYVLLVCEFSLRFLEFDSILQDLEHPFQETKDFMLLLIPKILAAVLQTLQRTLYIFFLFFFWQDQPGNHPFLNKWCVNSGYGADFLLLAHINPCLSPSSGVCESSRDFLFRPLIWVLLVYFSADLCRSFLPNPGSEDLKEGLML